MVLEYMILLAAWILTIIALLLFIPRDKIRQAHIAFLFKQLLTWVFGLSVVQLKLIEYPVRLFPYANRASFTFEFFVYPAICAICFVHYPERKSKIIKFSYIAVYTSCMTLFETIIGKYTELIHYIHWTWYWSWITIFLTTWITIIYSRWFCQRK
jgi:hypothetical protein